MLYCDMLHGSIYGKAKAKDIKEKGLIKASEEEKDD